MAPPYQCSASNLHPFPRPCYALERSDGTVGGGRSHPDGSAVFPLQYDEHVISPKEFVHLAGKSTLKDWKRAIRMNGIMLRWASCGLVVSSGAPRFLPGSPVGVIASDIRSALAHLLGSFPLRMQSTRSGWVVPSDLGVRVPWPVVYTLSSGSGAACPDCVCAWRLRVSLFGSWCLRVCRGSQSGPWLPCVRSGCAGLRLPW